MDIKNWYLGGMVAVQDKAEAPLKPTAADLKGGKDKYEISQDLHDKLNSILADEFLAYITYKMCEVAMAGNKQHILEEVSGENGKDELDDHFKNLYLWMQSKGLRVVTSIEEMQRITNCKKWQVTDGEDTQEVLGILTDSEREAIAVYEKILDDDEVKYDLRTMLSDFLKDEREHLKRLEDVKAEMFGKR